MSKIQKKIKKNSNKLFLKLKKISEKRKAFFKKHLILRILVIILSIVLFLYVLLFCAAKYIETVATFPGMFVNTLEYTQDDISQTTLDFQDINIDFDGENINGLYVDNAQEKTIYYLHGNGGELKLFYNAIQKIGDLGYNVLALDYPGYGESTGIPYEENVQAYVDRLYAYAQDTYRLIPENTIIWGYSVGSGIALDFTQRTGKDFFKIILEAPYTSRYDLSQKIYGIALQKYFFRENSFISKENILSNDTSLLILHGHQDAIIPFSMGQELYNISNKEITSFIEIPDGSHYNLLDTQVVLEKIKDFLRSEISISFYDTIEKSDFDAYLFQKYLRELDFSTDTSLQKYVDPDVSFNEKGYIPKDMQALKREFISDTKGDAQMREEAAENFEQMAEDFYREFEEKIVVVSSYRSYNYQAGIKARGCPDNLCAKAGYSEHQSGLTADLWSASSDAYWKSSTRLMGFYDWLDKNAHIYGFHNSYQKGRETDGYEIEPWHWRYLGSKLATYLKENDLTFAEFYYK